MWSVRRRYSDGSEWVGEMWGVHGCAGRERERQEGRRARGSGGEEKEREETEGAEGEKERRRGRRKRAGRVQCVRRVWEEGGSLPGGEVGEAEEAALVLQGATSRGAEEEDEGAACVWRGLLREGDEGERWGCSETGEMEGDAGDGRA